MTERKYPAVEQRIWRVPALPLEIDFRRAALAADGDRSDDPIGRKIPNRLQLVAAEPTHAGRRIAPVIGNSNYANPPALANPVNDASDVAEALRALGYAMRLQLDANQRDFDRAREAFSRDAVAATGGVQSPELSISLRLEEYIAGSETYQAVWARVRATPDPQPL